MLYNFVIDDSPLSTTLTKLDPWNPWKQGQGAKWPAPLNSAHPIWYTNPYSLSSYPTPFSKKVPRHFYLKTLYIII